MSSTYYENMYNLYKNYGRSRYYNNTKGKKITPVFLSNQGLLANISNDQVRYTTIRNHYSKLSFIELNVSRMEEGQVRWFGVIDDLIQRFSLVKWSKLAEIGEFLRAMQDYQLCLLQHKRANNRASRGRLLSCGKNVIKRFQVMYRNLDLYHSFNYQQGVINKQCFGDPKIVNACALVLYHLGMLELETPLHVAPGYECRLPFVINVTRLSSPSYKERELELQEQQDDLPLQDGPLIDLSGSSHFHNMGHLQNIKSLVALAMSEIGCNEKHGEQLIHLVFRDRVRFTRTNYNFHQKLFKKCGMDVKFVSSNRFHTLQFSPAAKNDSYANEFAYAMTEAFAGAKLDVLRQKLVPVVTPINKALLALYKGKNLEYRNSKLVKNLDYRNSQLDRDSTGFFFPDNVSKQHVLLPADSVYREKMLQCYRTVVEKPIEFTSYGVDIDAHDILRQAEVNGVKELYCLSQEMLGVIGSEEDVQLLARLHNVKLHFLLPHCWQNVMSNNSLLHLLNELR